MQRDLDEEYLPSLRRPLWLSFHRVPLESPRVPSFKGDIDIDIDVGIDLSMDIDSE